MLDEHEERLDHIETEIVGIRSEMATKAELKEIRDKLDHLGNGYFPQMIKEQNQQLLQELLDRDDKQREFELKNKEMESQARIKKWKIVAGIIGGGVGAKGLELLYKFIVKVVG